MSLSSLRSEAYKLESELSRISALNNELRSEIAGAVNSVNRADNELNQYNRYMQNNLDNNDQIITASNNMAEAAFRLQGEIEQLYIKFKQVELANKTIRTLNNKKYYEFSNYRTVRKIVNGMMDNLDVQMVSNESIAKTIEKQHLQTPDYWLTCALISIIGWRNSDRELADKAVKRSVMLDKKSSSIFYMIFNLRMGREESALKWFAEYQKCDIKGSDKYTFLMLFSLINKTVAEKIDDDSKKVIKDYIEGILLKNEQEGDVYVHELTKQINQYILHMIQDRSFDYQILKRYCPEYRSLADIISLAKNNSNIVEFIARISNTSSDEKNNYLKQYIDLLVEEPNPKEKQVYDDINYNELIIKHKGELDVAKKEFEEIKSKKETDLNLAGEMIDWIFGGEHSEINRQNRLNMLTLLRNVFKTAVEQYSNSYRNMQSSRIQIKIGDYTATADMTDPTGEKRKIGTFYSQKRDGILAKIKDTMAYVAFGLGAAAAAGLFFEQFWLLAFTAAGAGYGLYTLISNKSKRQKVMLDSQDETRNAAEELDKLYEEYKRYMDEYKEYDSYTDKINLELDRL